MSCSESEPKRRRLEMTQAFEKVRINSDALTGKGLPSRTFQGYVVSNKRIPLSACIVETEMMRSFYDTLMKATDEKRERHFFSFEGPPGTGKTTTLIWLYHQLLRAGKDVICVPFHINDSDWETTEIFFEDKAKSIQIFVLSDFHEAHKVDKFSSEKWLSIFRNLNICVILSMSSAFHLVYELGHSRIRSFLSKLYGGFEVVHFKKEDDETMKKIMSEFAIEADEKKTLKESCGFPLMLRELKGNVSITTVLLKLWKQVLESDFVDKQLINNRINRDFLLALRYKLDVNELISNISLRQFSLIPTLCHLAYLNEDGIPTLHIAVPDLVIDEMIHRFLCLFVQKIDCQAAVGYVFESLCSKLFEIGFYIKVKEYTPFLKVVPKHGRLSSSDKTITKGLLYNTFVNCLGVDYVCITDLVVGDSERTFLIMVQVSVQEQNINAKLDNLLKVKLVWTDRETKKTPDKIIYLFLNPTLTSDCYESRLSHFNSLCPLRSHCAHWIYAEVAEQSVATTVAYHRQAKASLNDL